MAMPKKKESEKSVQVTITLDKNVFDKLEMVCNKIEDLPRSRFINRLLKRYFEQRCI